MKYLNGKVGFVTGGASGIGLGIAKAFLGQGLCVTIANINEEALASAAEELAQQDRVCTLRVEFSNRADLERAADETERVFGKVHVVCNNAGIA